MLWVKAVGVTAVFLCCCLFGYFKSETLKRRVALLEEIISGLSCLKEQIRCCGGELKILLPLCLGKTKAISLSPQGVKVIGAGLTEEDIHILDDLFKNLGSGDCTAECNRIERTVSILERQNTAALNELTQKGKLWQSGGVCIGAAICILLI